MCLDEVSELVEKPGAFCAGYVGAPGVVKGFAGGADGDVEVCFGAVGDGADGLGCMWVDYPGGMLVSAQCENMTGMFGRRSASIMFDVNADQYRIMTEEKRKCSERIRTRGCCHQSGLQTCHR